MMMLLANQDLATILLSFATGRLEETEIQVLPGYACNVIVAAGGYPGSYQSGNNIELGTCPGGTFTKLLVCYGYIRSF